MKRGATFAVIVRRMFCLPPMRALLGLALVFGSSRAAPLAEFRPHERVALLGGSLAERQSLFGHFEALLHSRFADKELVVRNFGWPADEVGRRQRPNDYAKIDDPLAIFGADTFLAFFGYNESFAGPPGVEAFKREYAKFLLDSAVGD